MDPVQLTNSRPPGPLRTDRKLSPCGSSPTTSPPPGQAAVETAPPMTIGTSAASTLRAAAGGQQRPIAISAASVGLRSSRSRSHAQCRSRPHARRAIGRLQRRRPAVQSKLDHLRVARMSRPFTLRWAFASFAALAAAWARRPGPGRHPRPRGRDGHLQEGRRQAGRDRLLLDGDRAVARSAPPGAGLQPPWHGERGDGPVQRRRERLFAGHSARSQGGGLLRQPHARLQGAGPARPGPRGFEHRRRHGAGLPLRVPRPRCRALRPRRIPPGRRRLRHGPRDEQGRRSAAGRPRPGAHEARPARQRRPRLLGGPRGRRRLHPGPARARAGLGAARQRRRGPPGPPGRSRGQPVGR